MTRQRRPMPFAGPYTAAHVGGACAVPCWHPLLHAYVWLLVSAEDYGLVMARRWQFARSGYPSCCVWNTGRRKAVTLYLHRLVTRAPAGVVVDHINHDLTDCRREALRLATPSQNSANTRRLSLVSTKSSHWRGVTRFKKAKSERWQAAIRYKGRSIHLGLYAHEEDAARAYDRKARELFGPFAVLNFAEDAA